MITEYKRTSTPEPECEPLSASNLPPWTKMCDTGTSSFARSTTADYRRNLRKMLWPHLDRDGQDALNAICNSYEAEILGFQVVRDASELAHSYLAVAEQPSAPEAATVRDLEIPALADEPPIPPYKPEALKREYDASYYELTPETPTILRSHERANEPGDLE